MPAAMACGAGDVTPVAMGYAQVSIKCGAGLDEM